MTIGEMLRSFLTKLEWFSTLFPRIPVPVQKNIDQQIKTRPRKIKKDGKEGVEELDRHVERRRSRWCSSHCFKMGLCKVGDSWEWQVLRIDVCFSYPPSKNSGFVSPTTFLVKLCISSENSWVIFCAPLVLSIDIRVHAKQALCHKLHLSRVFRAELVGSCVQSTRECLVLTVSPNGLRVCQASVLLSYKYPGPSCVLFIPVSSFPLLSGLQGDHWVHGGLQEDQEVEVITGRAMDLLVSTEN